MKTINNIKKGPLNARAPFTLLKQLGLSVLLMTGVQTTVQAQEDSIKMTAPSWWFGAAVGANFNFYDGSTQRMNSTLITPTPFNNGDGIGLYLGPLVEYYKPGSRWGIMLQAGYDNRKGTYDEVLSPCNCPADLSTKLSYISFEPSLRLAPFKGDFFLYAGPRFAYNINKSFTYQQRANPEYPEQADGPVITGDFSEVKSMLVSMQVGMGYDIHLSAKEKRGQVMLTPFVAFHPYFGQSPRDMETWNVTTLRGGIALKFGRGHDNSPKEEKIPEVVVVPVVPIESVVAFSIHAPANVPVERRVRETFPLRNYVYFDLGSKEIPDRYVLLEKDQVKDFKEDQLEEFKPKTLSGRSSRQMVAYYNIINIVGDRMGKNPSATIVLVGSSEQGPADGKAMSESIKKYLVDVFGISGSRISTEGRSRPAVPSGNVGGTEELVLLSQGNRRVSIESTSPALLMEFKSGPETPLKPVEIEGVQEAPLDSYVTFDADGGEDAFTSWSLEIKDEKGAIQHFGPYTQKTMALSGKSILGTREKGDFTVTMIGKTESGKTVRKEEEVHMVLWTPPKDEIGMRYSVIFEYNDAETAKMYEKYLSEIVGPKITDGATVIIHGYTDVIGNDLHNQKLAESRAKDVHSILAKSVAKTKRKNVKFEVHGFGEDQQLSPFENKYPEERSYNRTVVIDIIPKK